MKSNLETIKAEFDNMADQLIDSLIKLSPNINDSEPSLYQQVSNQFIERLILRVMEWSKGNQAKAAKKLGITRATLRRRMNDCGITKDMVSKSD